MIELFIPAIVLAIVWCALGFLVGRRYERRVSGGIWLDTRGSHDTNPFSDGPQETGDE